MGYAEGGRALSSEPERQRRAQGHLWCCTVARPCAADLFGPDDQDLPRR